MKQIATKWYFWAAAVVIVYLAFQFFSEKKTATVKKVEADKTA